ncbi:hypothetical protein SVAN01_05855 [Stagonosporopsis vannaccii]|nr:hypothetical protein SVAN01_05855 [Stagonosporopsis vannaccii]
MRSHRLLLVCFSLILCLHSVIAVPQHAVRRQDDDASDRSQSPTISASSRPSATVTASEDDTSVSTTEPKRISSAPTASSSVETSTSMPVPAASSAAPQSTISAEADPENPLPLQPSLTPAMGISGVVLLLSGLTFTIIGIKNKWVYVFGSAAYLSALAVTVLIVYLMNPPVSDGVQGAFFVAAFFTGVIFGAVSLVFPDITEGFGCLLGGFCLSMWFLCLKSGGLISSVTGRAIFIGCMSAGGYCLSFSHYTRNHGLIASIAFSGATATILGIDCLSRAGIKEFWLYLWALNDDVFPLSTNSYPITKNIKAELAGIVIIAVLGVVSQLRVWNLVKEHREKSAAQQLERKQDQDREEEALGRQLEDSFQRERAQWEAAYGEKGAHQESSVASSTLSPKNSTSLREKEMFATDSLELVNMEKSGVVRSANPDTPAGTTVTVSVLKDDIQQIDAQGNPITYREAGSSSGSVSDDKDLPATPDAALADNVTKTSSLRPSAVPPPPAVIPLPFKVPEEGYEKSEDEDNASVSAVAETTDVSYAGHRPVSKRISDMSNPRKPASQRNSRHISESQEDLINVPHVEDDRASSIAATLDDEHDATSLRQLSPPQSPIGTEHSNTGVESPELPTEVAITTSEAEEQGTADDEAKETGFIVQDATEEAHARPTMRQSLTVSTDPPQSAATVMRSPRRNSRFRADTLVSTAKGNSDGEQSKFSSEKALSQSSQTEHDSCHVESLKESALPRFSKVALSYRTNEWAKHLETADLPELEELSVPASPGAALDHGAEEVPAPVSDEIAAPLIGSQRDSKRMSMASRNKPGLNRSTSISQQSLAEQQTMSRSPSVLSSRVLSRSNSGTRLDALSPLPTNTLMGQRESLIRNRVSSHSFSPLPSPGPTLLEQSEQDNMTLAQRRQLLKQGPTSPLLQEQPPLVSPRRPPPSTAQKWQKKGWAGQKMAAGFDSHQPQRMASTQSKRRREDLYADWREKIRDVTPPETAAYVAEQQRAALLQDRRQKELDRQQREAAQQQRASMMDNMMRSGQMLDAHRDAMRKMQANANKRAA